MSEKEQVLKALQDRVGRDKASKLLELSDAITRVVEINRSRSAAQRRKEYQNSRFVELE